MSEEKQKEKFSSSPQQEAEQINSQTCLHSHKLSQRFTNEFNPEIEEEDKTHNKINENDKGYETVSTGTNSECVLCAQLISKQLLMQIFYCKHTFCSECLSIYAKMQIQKFKIVRCPFQECRAQMKNQKILALTPSLQQKYTRVKARNRILSTPGVILCPDQKCVNGYIKKPMFLGGSGQDRSASKEQKEKYCKGKDKNEDIQKHKEKQTDKQKQKDKDKENENENIKNYSENIKDQTNKLKNINDKNRVQCEICHKIFCYKCRSIWHLGSCQQFYNVLVKDKWRYQRCKNCRVVIEKIVGCEHITCKCGAQFCYYCGESWSSAHSCLRLAAGGSLITQKVYEKLSCLRCQKYEYDNSIEGHLSRVPVYFLMALFFTFYGLWYLLILLILFIGTLAVSLVFGAIFFLYDLYSKNKCLFFVGILLLPLTYSISVGFFFVSSFTKVCKRYYRSVITGNLSSLCS